MYFLREFHNSGYDKPTKCPKTLQRDALEVVKDKTKHYLKIAIDLLRAVLGMPIRRQKGKFTDRYSELRNCTYKTIHYCHISWSESVHEHAELWAVNNHLQKNVGYSSKEVTIFAHCTSAKLKSDYCNIPLSQILETIDPFFRCLCVYESVGCMDSNWKHTNCK